MDRELGRQLFHIFIGICAIVLLLHFGRGFMTGFLFFTIIIGTLLINIKVQGGKVPLIDWFEERFERSDAPLPGWGSACYAAGALLAVTFLPNLNEIAAVIFVLAFGDGMSTIIGRYGKIRLPYNNKKTLEGSAAMFVFSLPAYFFIGPAAIALSLVGTLAESLPFVEDNLWIPIACTALLAII